MQVSAEIRWFWAQEPKRVAAWFLDVATHGMGAGGGVEERTDAYLDDPDQRELGVKVRGSVGGEGGGVEVKGLVAVRHGRLGSGRFAGPVEIWSKWAAPRLEVNAARSVVLAKRRWLRTFDTGGAAPRELALGPHERPLEAGTPPPVLGGNVEWTRVTPRAGSPVWTLGFEAFGPLSTVEESLLAIVVALEARDPPSLEGARRASYPAWLATRLR